MFKNIFSHKGRIRRLEYTAVLLMYLLVNISILSIAFQPDGKENPSILILFIPTTFFILIQGVKRCHDIGKSGWFQFIPFYFLLLIFLDSSHGKNIFGNNPKGIGNYEEINEIGIQTKSE